ncbi:MAG: hypothetical protein ACI8ZM_005153 [Crocinitomix sp.]|jgi:hypothetical protein
MNALKFLPIIIVLFSACQKEPFPPIAVFENENYSDLIVNSKWLVTRYDNIETGNIYEPNDTLWFSSDSTYSINGGDLRAYSLLGAYYDNQLQITLRDCYTFGGSYRGLILKTFAQDEEINNVRMNNLYVEDELAVWLERI